jgi:hypothetical protein
MDRAHAVLLGTAALGAFVRRGLYDD